jgi:hypothetical protein
LGSAKGLQGLKQGGQAFLPALDGVESVLLIFLLFLSKKNTTYA